MQTLVLWKLLQWL